MLATCVCAQGLQCPVGMAARHYVSAFRVSTLFSHQCLFHCSDSWGFHFYPHGIPFRSFPLPLCFDCWSQFLGKKHICETFWNLWNISVFFFTWGDLIICIQDFYFWVRTYFYPFWWSSSNCFKYFVLFSQPYSSLWLDGWPSWGDLFLLSICLSSGWADSTFLYVLKIFFPLYF